MQSSLRWCVCFSIIFLKEQLLKEKKNSLAKRWSSDMPSIYYKHLSLMIKAPGSYQKDIKAFFEKKITMNFRCKKEITN